MERQTPPPFSFPQWTDRAVKILVGAALAFLTALAVIAAFSASPLATDALHQPKQPVPYSHLVHVDQLGLDCRYCHNTVETSAQASIPPTQTCMNCHHSILPDSEKLQLVRESAAAGKPIPWVRVHKLPDFAYFSHKAHVNRGVGCVSCHGRVDKMEVVRQDKPLRMGMCLDCHNDPAPHIRPLETATKMDWAPMGENPGAMGQKLVEEYNIQTSRDCSTCHR